MSETAELLARRLYERFGEVRGVWHRPWEELDDTARREWRDEAAKLGTPPD